MLEVTSCKCTRTSRKFHCCGAPAKGTDTVWIGNLVLNIQIPFKSHFKYEFQLQQQEASPKKRHCHAFFPIKMHLYLYQRSTLKVLGRHRKGILRACFPHLFTSIMLGCKNKLRIFYEASYVFSLHVSEYVLH